MISVLYSISYNLPKFQKCINLWAIGKRAVFNHLDLIKKYEKKLQICFFF